MWYKNGYLRKNGVSTYLQRRLSIKIQTLEYEFTNKDPAVLF